jgi:aldehyde dehydrogenase (NAD+)
MSTLGSAQEAPAAVNIEPGRLFIEGKWCDSSSGETTTTINPATEQPITTVAKGTADDARRAAAAAKRAFEESGWATLRGSERARVLQRIADLIERNAHELAYREAIDMGMLYEDAARSRTSRTCFAITAAGRARSTAPCGGRSHYPARTEP